MAITVASDQTLFNATGGDAEVITNWTITATWSTNPVTDGDMYLQSTTALSCIGGRASGGGTATMFWDHLTTSASLDLTTGNHAFFWIKCITIPAMDARVRGGIGLSISSGTDVTTLSGTVPWNGIGVSKQWFLTGNDIDTTSGWVCYVVDPTSVADLTIGSADMTSVDRIGIRVNVINGVGAGSFKPKNILWDAIRYGTKLTITGSTGTFQDIYAADSTTANQYGILNKSAGIFFGGGKLIFGTTGQSAPCILTDTKQTLVWQDFPVASSFYEIQLVGNTTPNVTTVTLGTYSGGLTSNGCTIKGTGLETQRLIAPVIVSGGTGYTANDTLTVTGGTGTITAQFRVITVSSGVITEIRMQTAGAYSVPPTGTLSVTGGTGSSATFTATVAGGSIWTLTASAANQTLNLYGCTFSEMLSAALTTTSVVRGCTFTNFGTVTTGGALIDSCTFQDVRTATPISATYALIVASATEMSTITNSKFINCNRAIKITASGSYTFDDLTFSGNTYDIENSASSGTVTINATGTSNPGTYTYIHTGISFEASSAQSYNANTTTYTDEVTDINDTDASDVALPPIQATTAGDAIYLGHSSTFTGVTLVLGTKGTYSDITITWQYWNGAWTTISDIVDNTSAFSAVAGTYTINFRDPIDNEDWATTDVNGTTKYWIRAVTTFGASPVVTTAPLGTQAWHGYTLVNNTVTLTVTVKNTSGVAVSGARVRIETSGGTLISEGSTNGSGIYTDATYNYGGDVEINVVVRLKGYINFKTTGTIESTGLNVGVRFIRDEIVNLP